MEEIVNLDPAATERMVNSVNFDLLPFFDTHSEMDFNFTEEYKVVQLLGHVGKDYIFERAKGGQIGVWKDYFEDPETWMKERELKLKGLFY